MQVLLILILFPVLGHCELVCSVQPNVNHSDLMLGEAAIAGLKIEPERNLFKLHVLECKCDTDDKVWMT